MTEQLRSPMCLRPDHVVVGEARLDLIKVWGSSHPECISTPQATYALDATLRMRQLLEVAVSPTRTLLTRAINVVIRIAGCGH
ncbi:TPA: Flp pilus assembly complex ATPase component TadA [Pseudomonas aeruginosa]|nr:Flp pilus assembly complex ATPase component TadA [Pseudomonas aeruginosa]HCF5444182.1 Flp pilus assembly complex ATPase component TadA [Pseudomonas aeruginosa]HCF5448264.1 Flp pilus assembly complex ATPase component TadA [Pseudomonas aeruginosa]